MLADVGLAMRRISKLIRGKGDRFKGGIILFCVIADVVCWRRMEGELRERERERERGGTFSVMFWLTPQKCKSSSQERISE